MSPAGQRDTPPPPLPPGGHAQPVRAGDAAADAAGAYRPARATRVTRPNAPMSPRASAAVLGARMLAWRAGPGAARRATAQLVTLAQRGDPHALNELVRAHVPHVRGVCRVLRVRPADVDDFVQEGLEAMLVPVQRYDPARGVPLWGYARPFVKGRLVEKLGQGLGLSPHEIRHYRPVRRAHDRLSAEGRDVTVESVHAALKAEGRGVGLETVRAVLELSTVHWVRGGDLPADDLPEGDAFSGADS